MRCESLPSPPGVLKPFPLQHRTRPGGSFRPHSCGPRSPGRGNGVQRLPVDRVRLDVRESTHDGLGPQVWVRHDHILAPPPVGGEEPTADEGHALVHHIESVLLGQFKRRVDAWFHVGGQPHDELGLAIPQEKGVPEPVVGRGRVH
eukprot:3633746-Prymnesium_polylepis.3